MDVRKNTIKCSVGVLTYNSEKTIRRTLESVKDFSTIIISDGGSTDSTLDIAREYGCTIIEQYAKTHPSKDSQHPIGDFALERNRMLDIATLDWFLWLDSDEYISKELHAEIACVCSKQTPEFLAYQIPAVHQSPDALVTYRAWKQIYQMRFFNVRTGGVFQRKIHERFVFDAERYPVGTLTGSWFIPISKIDFQEYKKAVEYRLGVMLADVIPENVWIYYLKALYRPLKRTVGILGRDMFLRLRYSKHELMPFGYTRNRLYSQWVTFRIVTQLYFSKKR